MLIISKYKALQKIKVEIVMSNPTKETSTSRYGHSQTKDIMEDFYAIERIYGKKIIDGQKLYLVKWCDYPESESTWEPVENLLNVVDMIVEYEVKESIKGVDAEEEQVSTKASPEKKVKRKASYDLSEEEQPTKKVKEDVNSQLPLKTIMEQEDKEKWLDKRMGFVGAFEAFYEKTLTNEEKEALKRKKNNKKLEESGTKHKRRKEEAEEVKRPLSQKETEINIWMPKGGKSESVEKLWSYSALTFIEVMEGIQMKNVEEHVVLSQSSAKSKIYTRRSMKAQDKENDEGRDPLSQTNREIALKMLGLKGEGEKEVDKCVKKKKVQEALLTKKDEWKKDEVQIMILEEKGEKKRGRPKKKLSVDNKNGKADGSKVKKEHKEVHDKGRKEDKQIKKEKYRKKGKECPSKSENQISGDLLALQNDREEWKRSQNKKTDDGKKKSSKGYKKDHDSGLRAIKREEEENEGSDQNNNERKFGAEVIVEIKEIAIGEKDRTIKKEKETSREGETLKNVSNSKKKEGRGRTEQIIRKN